MVEQFWPSTSSMLVSYTLKLYSPCSNPVTEPSTLTGESGLAWVRVKVELTSPSVLKVDSPA